MTIVDWDNAKKRMKRYNDGVAHRSSAKRSKCLTEDRTVKPRSVQKKKYLKDVERVDYKMVYQPKKERKQKATFKHRSGHEQKK